MTDLAALSLQTRIPLGRLQAASDTLVEIGVALRVNPREAVLRLIPDGRGAQWRARVRIVDAGRETLADTDPDAGHGDRGAEVLPSLPAVATFAADLVAAWHSLPSAAVLPLFRDRLPSLRTALARGGHGYATWAIPYQFDGAAYTARVDVCRVVQARGTINRSVT